MSHNFLWRKVRDLQQESSPLYILMNFMQLTNMN